MTGRSMDMSRVREVGDSALLQDVGVMHGSSPHAIDERANASAIAIAAEVRARAIPGVRDVVSTFRSVAVFFDPLATNVAAVAASLHDAADAQVSSEPSFDGHAESARTVEVPVTYGGEAGPDLDAVARFAGCSPQAVIDRHAARTYRVFMLGFLPGFAYMASVDETIAMPRRATPRLRVAAGSVGIAGRQTGIYPRESPGGWQIIGRTSVAVFDPIRTPPSLFAPGDRVRFVAVPAGATLEAPRTPEAPRKGAPYERGAASDERRAGRYGPAHRVVTVLRPGLLTTVQDSGRWGYQDRGVSVSGPMDAVAHRLANALVGNARDAAALEATLAGPELRMEQDTTVAVAGADLRPTLDRADIPHAAPVHCRAGSLLRFDGRRVGVRAYVAFNGGIDVPTVLGSRATHLLSGLGGIDGRPLRAGDQLRLGAPSIAAGAALKGRPYAHTLLPTGGARLRVLPGPQSDHFDPDALDVLQRARFVISAQSDRVGYRLTGGEPLRHTERAEMISDVAFLGAVQVPPSGEPILLMADRQTTGGYPQLAIVISADVALAAQLAPGDWVEFELCTRAQAISALVAQEGKLLAVR